MREFPVENHQPVFYLGQRTCDMSRKNMKPHIAILEDHVDTLEMLQIGLATEFSISVYQSAVQLLAALENENFSAILADIMLPGMDGFEFVRAVRRHPRYANVCVIAVTALAMTREREHGIAAGFTDFLIKPTTPDQITSALKRWIASGPRKPSAA